MDNLVFQPSILLKSSYLQTYLASKIPLNHVHYINHRSNSYLLDTGSDSVLLVRYSKQISSKGLCILIHGWEGSSDSAYIIRTANFLYKEGYMESYIRKKVGLVGVIKLIISDLYI